MSQEEKNNYISLVSTLVVTIPYLFFILNKYQGESLSTIEELKFWASAILILIPIRIAVEIIMNIAAAILTAIITNKDNDSVTDERDGLIDLKSTRISHYFFMLGFVISLLAMVIYGSPTLMLGILFLTGFATELVGISSKIFYYRKGI